MPGDDPTGAPVAPGRHLSGRERRVLQALVTEYLGSGEPIASRSLSRVGGMDLSSATIRNVMSDLEELHLLSQPYHSAGRTPTEQGLRYYVECLLVSRQLTPEERAAIRSGAQRGATVEEVLRESSRVLSDLTGQTGVVLLPRVDTLHLKHIDFVLLAERQVLAILVSADGRVRNSIAEVDVALTRTDLERMSNYLNESFAGLPLADVRRRIREELARDRALHDELVQRALTLGATAMERQTDAAAGAGDLIVEGQAHLLDSKELAEDPARLKQLVEALEEKERIARMLAQIAEAPQVRVFLGADIQIEELDDVAIVAGGYGTGGEVIGSLGVIGPTRMDYARVVGLVDCTARLLSSAVEDRILSGSGTRRQDEPT
ncbi:MAG TPA: heat-inducible transcriptional repressor HrcA [Myxococcota bacterium]|jgi:heat-inducible transcriptional repressor|nr:heat-inducible transcriptional repressor HrcA [Myxococcota bacterium]